VRVTPTLGFRQLSLAAAAFCLAPALLWQLGCCDSFKTWCSCRLKSKAVVSDSSVKVVVMLAAKSVERRILGAHAPSVNVATDTVLDLTQGALVCSACWILPLQVAGPARYFVLLRVHRIICTGCVAPAGGGFAPSGNGCCTRCWYFLAS
jgi:hypothetical protein